MLDIAEGERSGAGTKRCPLCPVVLQDGKWNQLYLQWAKCTYRLMRYPFLLSPFSFSVFPFGTYPQVPKCKVGDFISPLVLWSFSITLINKIKSLSKIVTFTPLDTLFHGRPRDVFCSNNLNFIKHKLYRVETKNNH